MLREVAGQTVWVAEDGEGPPRLFIHCSLARGRTLRPLAAALPPGRNIFFDLPGHGQSADWAGADYHGDTLRIAEQLLDGPAHIIGHSFGATVALRMAIEARHVVSRVTLIEPVMFAAARADDAVAAHRAAFQPFVDAYARGDLGAASAVFVDMWGAGPDWATLPQAARDRMIGQIHMIPAAAPVIEDDVPGLVGRLGDITCPVDLIEAEHSQPIMAAIMDGLQAGIPHARHHLIKGSGHMAPITHPEDVARAVSE